MEEVEKWLLNSARNANRPTPVASVITTKKCAETVGLNEVGEASHEASKERKATPENDENSRNEASDRGFKSPIQLA